MLQGCVTCCAPYSLVCSILLFCMFHMLKHDNWTFSVISAKLEWNKSDKAECCLRAAITYLFISVLLWMLVLIDALLISLADLTEWRRFYQGGILSTLAYLFRRRQEHRQRVKDMRQKKMEAFRVFHEEMVEMEGRATDRMAEEANDSSEPASPKTPLVPQRSDTNTPH